MRIDNQRLAEYESAYIVLKTRGQSHQQAVAELRAMLQSFHIPRFLKTQNIPRKLCILHDSDPFGVIPYHPGTHRKIG